MNQKSDWTVIAKESTCAAGPGAEPYYPVPTQVNRDAYKKYAELAAAEEGVHFVGRLASYKYFNMDQAIRNSLDYFRDVLKPRIESMRKECPKIVISELVAAEA